MTAQPTVVRGKSAPETVHSAAYSSESGATNCGAERAVDERRSIQRSVDGVFNKHREQASERFVFVEASHSQSVVHRPGEIADQQQVPVPERSSPAKRIRQIMDGQLHPSTAGSPEGSSDAIQESPEFAASRTIAKATETFIRPTGGIAIQGYCAVREPPHITGKDLPLERRHTNRLKELAAHTSGFEVDQRRGSDIESESRAAKEASAAARQTMRLEDKGSEPCCLKPGSSGHPCDACPDDGDVVHCLVPSDAV